VSIIWVDLGKQNGGCTKDTFCFRSDGENKPLETRVSKSLWKKIINITKNVVSSSVEDSQQTTNMAQVQQEVWLYELHP